MNDETRAAVERVERLLDLQVPPGEKPRTTVDDADLTLLVAAVRGDGVDAYRPSFGEPVGPWHRLFALRPVNTLDRGWVWLRPVYRRRCQKHDYLDGPMLWWWQYVVEPRP